MFNFKYKRAGRKPQMPPDGREWMLLEGQRSFFGQKNLLVLVALVTLLLQCISFMTTLQGATLFLAGIFTLAPLFFALAVQATAWFLAGSLRVSVTPLRCIALGLALCCSTYYSYVGIYNNVNPPAAYLASEYAQVSSRLQTAYDGYTGSVWRNARDEINRMAAALSEQYALLGEKAVRLNACQAELTEAGASYAGQLRAPSRGSYAKYEDYVAAYNAYLASVTSNTGSEEAAARSLILSRYGFESEAALAGAMAQNNAALTAFETAASALTTTGETTAARLEQARAELLAALTEAETTGELPAGARAALARLTQLYADEAGGTQTTDELLAPIEAALSGGLQPLMESFDMLSAQLPGGKVTKSNAQGMKTLMSSQILSALLRVNALAPAGETFLAADPALQITDLHLKPIFDLAAPERQSMALFCLGLAALMDGLTLTFSLVCRRRRTLLYSRTPIPALAENGQVLAAQLAACLPAGRDPLDELELFLAQFAASPVTLPRGYSLAAPRPALIAYERLIALLCQLDLARIEQNETGDAVFLRTNFLLFANELCAKRQKAELSVRLEQQAAAQRQAALLGQNS